MSRASAGLRAGFRIAWVRVTRICLENEDETMWNAQCCQLFDVASELVGIRVLP